MKFSNYLKVLYSTKYVYFIFHLIKKRNCSYQLNSNKCTMIISLGIFNYLMVHLNIALKRGALITYVSTKSLENVVFFFKSF